VYDQLGSFLLLCLVTPWVIASAAGTSPPTRRQMATRVVTFPPFIALMLALAPIAHPAWLDEVLTIIGRALVPVAMFAVGLKLRLTPPKRAPAFVAGLVGKLVLMPALAYALTRLVHAPTEVRNVAVLESAMPSMISAGALAMAAGLAPELVAAWVGWGIVAAQITVPLWASLLR